MKTRTLTALLVIVVVFLWGRLRESEARLEDEQARSEEDAEIVRKWHSLNSGTSSFAKQWRRERAALSDEEKLRRAEQYAIYMSNLRANKETD